MLTGVSEIPSNPFHMSISPVPFHDQALISFDNKNSRPFTLTVYDIYGRRVMVENIWGNTFLLKRQGMQNGIYLVSLTDDKGISSTLKTVVE
jgi:hypothetical protein